MLEDRLEKLFKNYYKHLHKEDNVLRKEVVFDAEDDYLEVGVVNELTAPIPKLFSAIEKELCPGIEKVAAYIDGSLSDKEKVAIDKHIKGCKKCRKLVEDGKALMGLKNQDSLPDVPHQIDQKISENIRKYLQ
jgi:hypothetical protein